MERPALKRLLLDIKAGLVDIIVVYKIDRLTRSLMDFSKIVELLDKHNASFVSITQHFNNFLVFVSTSQHERGRTAKLGFIHMNSFA